MSAFEHGPGDDDDFDVDDDSPEIEAFRERARQGKAKDPTDDDDVTVDPTDDEPVVSLTRKEKKKERLALRDELTATRQELARLQGLVQGAMHRQPAVPDPTDDEDDGEAELDSALAEVQRKHTAAYNALRSKGAQATQADKDEYERQVRACERERIKLGASYSAKMAQAQAGVTVRQQVIQEQLHREHGDVYAAGPRAVQFSRGEFQKLLAMGEPDSAATVKKAMDATRVAFNIGRSTAPTESQRARFVAPPRGGNGGGGGSEGPTSIKMTKEFRGMADAAYPEIKDDKERYRKWANGPGREFLKAMR